MHNFMSHVLQRRQVCNQIKTIIDQVGLAVNFNENSSYTIGNTDFQCPELFVFHAPEMKDHYATLLNTVSRVMRESPHKNYLFVGNDSWTIAHGEQSLAVKSVLLDPFFAGIHAERICMYYGLGVHYRVLQILLPDAKGCFPNSVEYNPKDLHQPILRRH